MSRPEEAHPSTADGGGAPRAEIAPSGVRRRRTGPASPASAGVARGLAASVAVHALLATAILGATWGVVRAGADDEAPVVLTADFDAPAPTPPSSLPAPEPAPEASPDDATAATDLAARLRALEAGTAAAALDDLARRFAALAPEPPASTGAPAAARGGASFAGLVSGRAVDVAYVVDASGSMIGTFPKIVDEVARSISRLAPTQRFTVVVFRRDGADSCNDRGVLVPASRAERARAVDWLRDEVVPAGRSSPIEALGVALAAGADCVFLLSTTVTGPGRHDLDRDSTLALLERLNPRDPSTGVRRATIQCIQFLEEDPGGTLAAVADAHFGPGGYRFIPRTAVGLSALGGDDDSSTPPSPETGTNAP